MKRLPEIIISFLPSFSSSLEAKAVTFLVVCTREMAAGIVKVASLFSVTLNIRAKYRSKYSILRKESQCCFLAQLRGGE